MSTNKSTNYIQTRVHLVTKVIQSSCDTRVSHLSSIKQREY